MSVKAIRIATTKDLVNRNLPKGTAATKCHFLSVNETTNWTNAVTENPWLQTERLVARPDQLIKNPAKFDLVIENADLLTVQKWVKERMNKVELIEQRTGKIKTFVIEPFIPHLPDEEAYICIYSHRKADTILFHHQSRADTEDVDVKALKLEVPVGSSIPDIVTLTETLLIHITAAKKLMIAKFIEALYNLYVDLYFTYLEINPLVVTNEAIYLLDLAAKLDTTADFICRPVWGEIDYPPPFGRDAYPEEAYIADLDAKSGASLKLTVLNRNGRIWTMVAGGGASVVYTDTICNLGGASELANYGEYSGAPSEVQTYEYARTILSLMTKEKHPDGKVLIIGGGIANFTNVAHTFKGISKALQEFKQKLIDYDVKIFVRRAGPNYQEGLRFMQGVGKQLGIPCHVFGPEIHMTAICGMALGKSPILRREVPGFSTESLQLPSTSGYGLEEAKELASSLHVKRETIEEPGTNSARVKELFSKNTRAIVWGQQNRAVQGMLDFDFACARTKPSVAAIVYPFADDHKEKFYWGPKEVVLSVYKKMEDAMENHREADVLVTFASLRSAYDNVKEALEFKQIKTIAIIAEGIPENMTRKMIRLAQEKGVTIVGPATVGGLKPGCFRIGNSGGTIDNILENKLYRPGSVAYVSRSGGMSNELNNIIFKSSNGVLEGIAIGGDRYPGSTFLDHIMRYENNPEVKLIILLGEVGGIEEYEVCEALKSKKITKPLIAWCVGTCADMLKSEIQFGHAGSIARSCVETAVAKNAALKTAGANVPDSFDDLEDLIRSIYQGLVTSGAIISELEVFPPAVPMDYSWARELGLIRKPASFTTSICDERGQELRYADIPVSEVVEQNVGIGGVVSLLWFQRCLPPIFCRFLEMSLMLTADHGPAVSGAHNTIVCARAGKDLVSSLVSGLLTIGDRFGGALDGAARMFSKAYDEGLHAQEFVNDMRKEGKLIMGIGHRVKSINNPDMRVKLIKDYVLENFPAKPLVQYALEVEEITSSKKPNLILNVDGIIACAFVDMLRNSGSFTKEEAQEYVEIGSINSLFVLGRTIGFIGHFMDQKRLKQGLYRHPWDDISYVVPEQYD